MSSHTLSAGARGTITLEPRGRAADSTLIFMHGLGDTAEGWVDTVAGAFAPVLRSTRFVLLTAPTRPITVNGGMPMPGWYDILSFSKSRMTGNAEAAEGLAGSTATVAAAIAAEVAKGIPHARIMLGGFSQGGAMSLHAGLNTEATLGGILSMSGYLCHPSGLKPTAASRATPVLLLHGEEDPLVLLAYGKESAEKIRAAGVASVELKTYAGLTHSASPEELGDALAFLRAQLK